MIAPWLILVVLILYANDLSAADLYVSASGSDSNPGTQSAPFATIQRASQSTSAGTTIHVAPGTYAGNIHTKASGTSSAHVKYISDTLWGAKIVSACPSFDMIWQDDGSYVDVTGFDLSDNGSASSHCRGGFYGTGSYLTFRHNRVHDILTNATAWPYANNSSGGCGVQLDHYYGGVGGVVDGNLIYNLGPSGAKSSTAGHGIYQTGPSTVTNNIVYNVAGVGITTWHGAQSIDIINNTVDGARDCGICVGSGDSGGTSSTGDYLNVRNNIVTNTPSGILEGGTTGVHNTYMNNLFDNVGTTYSLQNGLTASGTVSANPMFVGSGDYHLQASSPAIDRGTSSGAPATDFDGNARPVGSGYDIGAFESGSIISR
jgi:hypothetical protein